MLGKAGKVSLYGVGGIGQCLDAGLALRDATGQTGALGHEHSVLILLDYDAILHKYLRS